MKVVRFSLILLFLALLSYLTWANFVPSGLLKIEKKINKPSPYFSDFYPSVRMKKIEQDENGIFFQRMVIDPVYFDLLMPRQFEKAKVKIKYQNPNQPLFQIGLKRIDQPWTFDFRKLLSPLTNTPLPPLEGGIGIKGLSSKEGDWTISENEFTLYPFLIDNRTLHFVLSSPDLDINLNEIKISDIEVTLEREPWTLENFWGRFRSYLGKLF